MAEDKPIPPGDTPPSEPGSSAPESPPAAQPEMSREEKIAAAKAKAEAVRAQRAATGVPPATPPRPTPTGGGKAWATAENPGGGPPTPPQHPKVQALGTITQSVELRCESTEDQNMRKILGGLGAYRNPLRGAWQIDYRYYAEALKRLQAAGYQVEGKDYLGRPLEQWAPEKRGWTRLS